MNLQRVLIMTLVLTFSGSAFCEEVSCQSQAEEAAIAKEKELNKKEKYEAKNTSKEVDSKAEATYVTEVYNSKGAFVPYDVVMKKAGCKVISVKATTL